MTEITPAEECAVELARRVFIDKEGFDKLDKTVLLSTLEENVGIISRYIREAEQRGREEALIDLDEAREKSEAPHD